MSPLLLSGALPDLSGLMPLFIIPVAAIIAAVSIPAMRFLKKRTDIRLRFLFALLAAINLGVGYVFLIIMHDVYKDAPELYKQHYILALILGYALAALLAGTGIYGGLVVLTRVLKRLRKAMWDRIG